MSIESISISSNHSIIDTLHFMDSSHHKMLIVLNNKTFLTIITIGDIQRAIIHNVDLNTPISDILDSSNKVFAHSSETKESLKAKMLKIRAEFMPVLNDNRELVDVVFWEDLFVDKPTTERPKIDLPVVIMAGGKGTRLKPITNVIPKPLVPIGDKTILEEIMDQFEEIGCKQFYMSINYKADMMRFYLGQLEHNYNIDFFEESKPLGTIGSVKLLQDKISTPFFVSNCDILIDQDYRDVYEYHQANHNDITIVTAVKSIKIPYGVIETGESGLMKGLTEKPEITYMINTGVYILEPQLIHEIPENELFHITHLMEKVKNRGGRVGCFPVSDNSWKDMGEWPEYLKLIHQI